MLINAFVASRLDYSNSHYRGLPSRVTVKLQSIEGWVPRSMISANHWLRGIKTYRLSWYLTRISANHASSNWAQNSAARLISWIRLSERITPVLKHFHWLPVEARIVFKVLLLTYKILNGQAAGYMASLITKYQPNRMLHSSSLSLLHVPTCTVKTVTYVLNLVNFLFLRSKNMALATTRHQIFWNFLNIHISP